jgi:hypothetical protein
MEQLHSLEIKNKGIFNFIKNYKSYIRVHAPPAIGSFLFDKKVETKRYIFDDGQSTVGVGFFSLVFNMNYGYVPENKT